MITNGNSCTNLKLHVRFGMTLASVGWYEALILDPSYGFNPYPLFHINELRDV